MPTLQTPHPSIVSRAPLSVTHPWWRSLVLCILLLISIALYILLRSAAPSRDDLITPFLQIWMLCFLPYFVACAFVLATRSVKGRWHWLELGIILAGALIFRTMLLSLPPGLSRDSWRYLWDARVFLHGFSPYVYAPADKVLGPLRDTLIFGNSRYRNVPTIYPPGAELLYVLSYLLAPSNLYFLKSLFVGFDMLTCGALIALLARKGLDPRRVILYAWCPLPIVEFAIQGHVDGITLTFTVLAVLAASSYKPGMRVLTGILIGIATLTKIYPILLLAVVLRPGEPGVREQLSTRVAPLLWLARALRRDWQLLLACFATICIGYLPFLLLGNGQVSGFFLTYAAEQGQNAGVIQRVTYWVGSHLALQLPTIISLEHIVDLALLGAVSLLVFMLRQLERISMGTATLLLIGLVLSISSHVFPWYTTALLPWIALELGPVWTRKGINGKALAVIASWYFTCTSLLGYFFNAAPDWSIYYIIVYVVVVAGLVIGALVGMRNLLSSRGNMKHPIARS